MGTAERLENIGHIIGAQDHAPSLRKPVEWQNNPLDEEHAGRIALLEDGRNKVLQAEWILDLHHAEQKRVGSRLGPAHPAVILHV